MPARREKLRQVAAVCYRRTHEGPLFLLVRTFDGKWTFPKGQVDFGMTEVEAAENEALEEAGVRGAIERNAFASYVYSKGNGGNPQPLVIEVRAYLLAVRETRPPPETFRNPAWFAPAAAKEALSEGRVTKYARELARIVDSAVARLAQ